MGRSVLDDWLKASEASSQLVNDHNLIPRITKQLNDCLALKLKGGANILTIICRILKVKRHNPKLDTRISVCPSFRVSRSGYPPPGF